jgi:phospholipase A1
MNCVLFVPGTMGTILSTAAGEVVWPPTPVEVALGYRRKDKLMQDDLVVGDIVRKVSCFNVYQPLIDTFAAMGFKESGAGDRLQLFPYDWRRDLEGLADQLAARFDALPAGTMSITVVAHSMGGLLARLVIERDKFKDKPWLKKIKAFITLATPHLGAPLALARILGLDSAMGISGADFKALAADKRYPSGYQLLPAPLEAACWNVKPHSLLGQLDIYDPAVAASLGLDPALVARARWVHDTLGQGKAPGQIRYFYFAATGHKTATRVNVGTGSPQVTQSEDAGDGTVPLWSALPKSGQKQLVVGEHASFFTGDIFNAVFYRLFDKDYAAAPLGIAAPTTTLSVQSIVIRAGQEIELVITPLKPASAIKGKIMLERTDDPDKPFAPFGEPIEIAYAGPPVSALKPHLPPPAQSGFYRLSFIGEPASSKALLFTVTDA